MKKHLLAAVAALAIGGVAHASDVTCHLTDQRGNTLDYTFRWATGDRAIQELGFTRNGQNANYNHTPLWHGFDNPDSSTITSDEAPGWFITYATTPGNGQAALWHNRNMVAQGECYNVPTVAAAPAYNPAPAPYNPPAPVASAGEDSVGLINVGKGVMVQVTLGSQPVTMIVDTGATDMLVSAKVADELFASGEASDEGNAGVQQADGKTVNERVILIHSLKIGQHTISEVRASVAPDGSDAMGLLPFPVLNRVGRFTIDTNNNKLIFGSPVQQAQVSDADVNGMISRGSIAGTLAQASKSCPSAYKTQGMLDAAASLYTSLQVQGVTHDERLVMEAEGVRNFNGAVSKKGLKFACDFATETMNAVFDTMNK